MSQHNEIEKKLSKAIINLVNKTIIKAMDTIDAHEGRYMKNELKLSEALEEPKIIKKRGYTRKFKKLKRK
jgi:hypothetical protein